MNARPSSDELTELLDLYRELARLEGDPEAGHRRWNDVVARVQELLPAVLADPPSLDRLREIGRTHEDESVRRHASMDADPPPPRSASGLAEWLAHPGVGLQELVASVRPAVRLAGLSLDDAAAEDEAFLDELFDVAADYPRHHDSSWLGGPPLGPLPTWPTRDDGVALVHVAQFDLRPWAWLAAEMPGVPVSDFPGSGVIQVFHDLETPGDRPGDGRRGAWLVRWVEVPEAAVDAPAGAEGPTPARALIEQEAAATLPSPEDIEDERIAERCDLARRRLLATNCEAGGVDLPPVDLWTLRPESHLFGHGWHSAREGREILTAAAPGGDGAEWLLLADIAGVGPLDQWFGDEGHLEVWVRAADVRARAFERAWVLMR